MTEGTHGGGHERREINVRLIAVAGAVLLVVVILSFAVTWLVLGHVVGREIRPVPSAGLLTGGPERQLPPEPRLQTHPLQDLQALRAEEEALLGGYGWVDREAGTVRIPIERAIELLAERGSARRGRE